MAQEGKLILGGANDPDTTNNISRITANVGGQDKGNGEDENGKPKEVNPYLESDNNERKDQELKA